VPSPDDSGSSVELSVRWTNSFQVFYLEAQVAAFHGRHAIFERWESRGRGGPLSRFFSFESYMKTFYRIFSRHGGNAD